MQWLACAHILEAEFAIPAGRNVYLTGQLQETACIAVSPIIASLLPFEEFDS